MKVEGRLCTTATLASGQKGTSALLFKVRRGKAHHSLVPRKPTLIEAGIEDLTSTRISSVRSHFRALRECSYRGSLCRKVEEGSVK